MSVSLEAVGRAVHFSGLGKEVRLKDRRLVLLEMGGVSRLENDACELPFTRQPTLTFECDRVLRLVARVLPTASVWFSMGSIFGVTEPLHAR